VEALVTRDVWDIATMNSNRSGSSRAMLLTVTILRMEALEVVAPQEEDLAVALVVEDRVEGLEAAPVDLAVVDLAVVDPVAVGLAVVGLAAGLAVEEMDLAGRAGTEVEEEMVPVATMMSTETILEEMEVEEETEMMTMMITTTISTTTEVSLPPISIQFFIFDAISPDYTY
jgi:hypothetical protein